MTGLWFFTVLVGLVALERLAELVVSRRNAAWSLSRGGIEHGRGHFPPMVALHTGLLAGCLLEAWLARPVVPLALAASMFALVLLAQGLARSDVEWWVCHPGGPKVLQALEESLGLSSGETSLTWESLDRIGNLSSASVLFVLEDTLALRPPRPGSYGLLMALGPGFALEMVLLEA